MSSSKPFHVLQPVPTPGGTPSYETLRASILSEFASRVPSDLYLPESILTNPPKDVTLIPATCGLLTPSELAITSSYDAVALAAAIASRKLTAVAVATAFAKRAIIAHQLTCCLMDWFMDEAIERARSLDEHLERTGTTVGPLHGVPISIKEHMPVKGHYTTTGFLDTRVVSPEDCQMVAILRAAGAVFFCKTIQPQGIMHLESVSVYGRVLNPHNIHLSAGGSTGGEAALIAMRGSVLGIGTDIGGSIRGPAGFCGIYGFKPTSYSLPTKDFIVGGFGAELNVMSSTGPMSNSLRDLDLFVRVVKGAKPHLEDPRLVPIPWTGLGTPVGTEGKGPIKIGVLMDDGSITPQPPVRRAIEWAKAQLEEKSGTSFVLKPFAPFQAARAMKNIRKAYWPDGGKSVRAHIAATGEPTFPLTEWILKDANGPGVEMTASEVLQLRVERDEFRTEFAAHWAAQDVDVVLCPMFVGPACEHETAFYWNYTAFWNYVDYPGVVLPTPVRAGKKGSDEGERYEEDWVPLGEEDEHVRELWEAGDFEGAPVNVQLVGRKWYDNELFGVLETVKEALELR
ncbi:amidase signature domain-containing protein [Bombardia bombarda]|uniref:Amidase signature domain-containing protein n=1 Tax=Bombardia bombarda TaxID=252184 RepID=A0AA39U0V8_9PEZI|nr:amidase signature domain-containing protein [Bombardia bombarda]